MKVILIEDDYNKKHKLWKLLCLNHGSIEMDFVHGEFAEGCDITKEFSGIEVNLKEPMDAHKLEQALEFYLEFEESNNDSDDDEFQNDSYGGTA